MQIASTDGRQPNYFFPLAVVTLLTIYLLQFPSLTLHPEPYGETGTDFYYQARYLGIWENLWTPHGGYLPWLQRVVAVIGVKIFHLHELFVFGVQWFALVFIACSCALLCLDTFTRVSPSRTVRFLLALTIGLLPEYNLYSYVNFAYFGIIFVLFMILRQSAGASWVREIFFFTLLALTACTKTFFIVFLPVFFLRVVWELRHGYRARALLWMMPVASQLCQLAFMFAHRNLYTSTPSTNLTFVQRALQSIYFSFYSLGNVLIQNRSIIEYPSATTLIVWSFVGVLFVGSAVFIGYRRKDWRQIGWIVSLAGLAGASLFVATIMMPIPEIDWKQPAFLDQSRWFLFGYVLLLICLFSSLSVLVRGRLVTVVCSTYLAVTIYGNISRMQDSFADERDSFSQWNRYSALLSRDVYCVPLNPYPWIIGRRCHFLDEEGKDLVPLIDQAGTISAESIRDFAPSRPLVGVVVSLPADLARSAKVRVQALRKNPGDALEGTELSAPGSLHRYFFFDVPVEGWVGLTVSTDGSGPGLPAGSRLRVLGGYP